MASAVIRHVNSYLEGHIMEKLIITAAILALVGCGIKNSSDDEIQDAKNETSAKNDQLKSFNIIYT